MPDYVYFSAMNLPPNIAALSEDPMVVDTVEVLVAFFGREDIEFSGANLALAQFLADEDALTPHALAVLLLAAHMDMADVNDNGDSLPQAVAHSAMAFLQPLPAGARTSDLQASMLMDDTTAAMLHQATFLLQVRETRKHLCDKHGEPYDDDSLQVQFYMQTQLYIGAVSSMASDENIARFPDAFLRLCAREADKHLDLVCKLSNSYISGVGHAAMEMTDTMSHFKARIEGYRSAYEARQAREAATLDNRSRLKTQMQTGAQRFKL